MNISQKLSPDVKHPALGLCLCRRGSKELPTAAVYREGVWLRSEKKNIFEHDLLKWGAAVLFSEKMRTPHFL